MEKQDVARSGRRRKSVQREENQVKYVLEPEVAHRFRAILDEAVERLELLHHITRDSSRNASKREPTQNNSRNRKDIIGLMEKEKTLEHQYENLMHRRWTLQGLSNRSKYLRNQTDILDLRKELKKSSMDIRQNLKDHPTITSNLAKIEKDRESLSLLLEATKTELHSLTFNKLVELVGLREKEQRRLQETKNQAEQTTQALQQTEQSLDDATTRFEHESEECNQRIAELTAKLKHQKKVTTLKVKYERETAIAQAEARRRQRDTILANLRDRIERASKGIFIDDKVHQTSHEFLQDKHAKIDQIATGWEKKKLEDEVRIRDANAQLAELHKHNAMQLEDFQSRWTKEQERQSQLRIEAAQRQRETNARKRLLKVMALAQCKIRLWWKVHQRHMAKKSKKKKKKGKGKKKKKKKS